MGDKECSPSQIWLAVSSRFDKGGGIGVRRDWSEHAKERERRETDLRFGQAFGGGREKSERERVRGVKRGREREKEEEREISTYTHIDRGRKIDEPV